MGKILGEEEKEKNYRYRKILEYAEINHIDLTQLPDDFMKKEKMKLWNKIVVAILVIILMTIIGIMAYKLYGLIDMDNRFQAFEKIPTVETKGKLSYDKENDI